MPSSSRLEGLGLADTLPTLQRVALAYAPPRARVDTLGLFALDARLASVLRKAKEPMLARIRFAWWREQISQPISQWPKGEPLLAALSIGWLAEQSALIALVDGWEELTDTPLGSNSVTALASARGQAFGALARLQGRGSAQDAAEEAARQWSLADIAAHLNDTDEQVIANTLVSDCEWQRISLPRELRPLALLHGLAWRAVKRGTKLDALPKRDVFTAIRLGLIGR